MRLIPFVLVLAMVIPSTVASGELIRTFYLPNDQSDEMDEAAMGDSRLISDGLVMEFTGRSYDRETPPLVPGLRIARTGSFHLHLEDRELVTSQATDVTTLVQIFVKGPTGMTVLGQDGLAYPLAEARVTFAHPGSRNMEQEGWTEFHMDVNSSYVPAPLTIDASAVILPPGSRLMLRFGPIENSESEGMTLGEQLAEPFYALGDAARDADTLPEAFGCPVDPRDDLGLPQATRFPCTVIGGLLTRELIANQIDQVGNGLAANPSLDADATFGLPVSTFVADDRASWLTIRSQVP